MTKAQELVFFLEEFITLKFIDMKAPSVETSVSLNGIRNDVITAVSKLLKEAGL